MMCSWRFSNGCVILTDGVDNATISVAGAIQGSKVIDCLTRQGVLLEEIKYNQLNIYCVT